MPKQIKCPNCGKTLLFHLDGCGASYSIKCRNWQCKETILIYSAGKTAVSEEILSFEQWENIVRRNHGIDQTKII